MDRNGGGAGALPPSDASHGPIIVTALLGEADFAWLDGLRRTHFPAERNRVSAHLTLFHHLAPSLEGELARRLVAETRREPAPSARIGGVMRLAQGTAFRVDSAELEMIRDRIAGAFAGYLTPQDAAVWQPHITIQNKVDAAAARALQMELGAGFRARPLAITGLASWRYLGGPWAAIGRYPFNRSGRSRRS